MNNFQLLEKRRKKLSFYISGAITFMLLFMQTIFVFSTYYTQNIALENKMILKAKWVENILKNKNEYTEKLNNNDPTIAAILGKLLDGVTIIKNNEKVLWDLNHGLFDTSSEFYNSRSLKFYTFDMVTDDSYKIIIKSENKFSYYYWAWNLLYFFLFSLPFSLAFYFIAYVFVGKNFKPIRETISSLESFSANINHELKTPLSEIISTLGLSKKLNSGHKEAVEQSLNSAHKISKLLDSMLWLINLVDSSYARQKINYKYDIEEIVNSYRKMAEKKNITLSLSIPNTTSKIKLNREHFHICVKNILQNAIKYSHDNWKIFISLTNDTLCIEDFGIWIDEWNLQNIFHRYFRENYVHHEGLGIWLSLVKKITEMNKWDIQIKSEKNIGTKITINFLNIWKNS